MKESTKEIIETFSNNMYKTEDTELIHRWLLENKDQQEKETALYSVWNKTGSKEDSKTEDSLKVVLDKIIRHSISLDRKKRNFRIFLQTVASVAAIFLSIVLTRHYSVNEQLEISMNECVVPEGETRELILPDGSRVKLNAGSVLFYPNEFNGSTRTIHLVGEAVFYVKPKPDQAFIVKSQSLEVKALGTTFNISAYPESDKITTTLVEGKVLVSFKNLNKEYILNPGEQIVFEKAGKEVFCSKVDLEDALDWTQGKIYLRGASVDEILKVMERKYNIVFHYNTAINVDKYNITLRPETSLEEALSILNYLIGPLSYNIDKNTSTCKIYQHKK